MIKLIQIAFLAAVILVTGCASNTQKPVTFNHSSIEPNEKIGVVMAPVPASTMNYPGASCLLCLLAAAAANSSLSEHAKTLDSSDLAKIREDVIDSLRSQGFNVQVIEIFEQESKLPKIKSKVLNSTRRNYSIYRTKYDIDHLVIINFSYAGITRNYSSYIPTGDPIANISGLVSMIDLNKNLYTIYKRVDAYKTAEGKWKEPPAFPGITNAYYQALEEAKDTVKQSVLAIEPEDTDPALTNTAK